jgi:copper homeostasis protein CutC
VKALKMMRIKSCILAERNIMSKEVTIEVCAFNLESCINAEKGGAGRIELYGNPTEGGTTPAPGVLIQAGERIIIMPGCGLRSYNVASILIKANTLAALNG